MATTSGEQTGTSQEEPKLVGRRRRTSSRRSDPAKLMSALGEARRSIQELTEDMRDRVEEHPFRALGLAVGAGYILGGGLFTALTGRLVFSGLRIGLRLAALPLVREEVMNFVETLSSDRGRGETERRQQ